MTLWLFILIFVEVVYEMIYEHGVVYYINKREKYHTIEAIPKSNIKILERGQIDPPNTQIHGSLFSLNDL